LIALIDGMFKRFLKQFLDFLVKFLTITSVGQLIKSVAGFERSASLLMGKWR